MPPGWIAAKYSASRFLLGVCVHFAEALVPLGDVEMNEGAAFNY